MRGQCLNVSYRNRFALDCIERNTLMLACSAGISLRLDFHVGVEKKLFPFTLTLDCLWRKMYVHACILK
jgi:hypothetical protein